ncbi:CAP domain-containing protein [Roseibacillus persicicus]|uniref:SCP domain-containing protein n=1 Tax=Roseibacillus persicicus TaxID=454148 RepID=A0A918TNK1_9BACT|nr:CAP domain-containing protein [Roseibacillus persicicus]GHC52890.1 hypothetical protein GCM10007100_19100 [Roseibacillus persicicus]
MKNLLLFLAFCLPVTLGAEDAPVVPNDLLRKALEWMESEDPARRKAAYSTIQLLSEEALPKFQTALFAAKSHHEKRLGRILSGGRDNAYQELEPVLEELTTERKRVYDLIKIDYKKDASKIKMLRNEVESVDRIYQRAIRFSANDLSPLTTQVEQVAQALVEIETELARIESHREGEDYEPDDSDLQRQWKEALEETYDGERFIKFQKNRDVFLQELSTLAAANKHNKDSAWASASQKDFADLLNQQRAIMGLRPLHLEEKLSFAATDHSKDMKALGFFAHESPVEGKKTPGDRARKAGYTGGWSGENIFMGSGSHASAYNAWFASDGHRFIMFANGPNELGIGPVGGHWTMMTGRR